MHIITQYLLTIVVAICTAASLTDEDIAKILDDTSRGDAISDLDQYDTNLQIASLRDKLRTLEGLDPDTSDLYPAQESGLLGDAVSKRPFCNGFTGCGRIHGKRTPSSSSSSSSSLLEKLQIADSVPTPIESPIAKRPFCNGFFGCGNPGKRLVFRNFVNPRLLSLHRSAQRKRFFCNPGAFGCTNRVKRSPLKSVLSLRNPELLR